MISVFPIQCHTGYGFVSNLWRFYRGKKIITEQMNITQNRRKKVYLAPLKEVCCQERSEVVNNNQQMGRWPEQKLLKRRGINSHWIPAKLPGNRGPPSPWPFHPLRLAKPATLSAVCNELLPQLLNKHNEFPGGWCISIRAQSPLDPSFSVCLSFLLSLRLLLGPKADQSWDKT